MKVIVTGGAGYIGSHTCKALSRAGYEPITVDSLVTGHRHAVRWGPLHEFDIRNIAALSQLFSEVRPTAVVHLAASAIVSDSMRDPLSYFDNNVHGTATLLEAAVASSVPSVVFSSSCATYGVPAQLPITELTPQRPVNPYGETKLACEQILRWVEAAHGTRWVALRYFNVAGADEEAEIGEEHENETHLVPRVLRAIDGGEDVPVYGTDYKTPDGTALRDYVHVADIADAHVAALSYLAKGGLSGGFNIGSGKPTSVREVIRAVERAVGRPASFREESARPGDPPALWADPFLSEKTFGWKARRSDIDNIVASAWAWETSVRATGLSPEAAAGTEIAQTTS